VTQVTSNHSKPKQVQAVRQIIFHGSEALTGVSIPKETDTSHTNDSTDNTEKSPMNHESKVMPASICKTLEKCHI
jgi:hypothetical protein